MKLLKRTLSLALSTILLFSLFLSNVKTNVYATPNTIASPFKVAVFLYSFDDLYLSHTKKNLEEIQKENPSKVEYTFFDAKRNQGIQNESIDKALEEDFDLFVISLASTKIDDTRNILTKIIQKNIPLILYSDPPTSLINFIRTYNRTVIIGGNHEQSGTLQGKFLVEAWNTNKKAMDKNNDNMLQYIILHGGIDDPAAISRTKYSIQALNDAGIKTEQLSLKYCNWDKECAKITTEQLILNLSNKIEAIIANNDAMAIGAIEALQKYGYNKGDKSKYIHVVGVDGIPEAQELIKQGVMTGTVIQDTRIGADAIYNIGMNLVSGGNPLKDTNYNFDETGITIRLPYSEYFN